MNERNKKRVRVRVSVREKKRKTIIYQEYVPAGDTKTKNTNKKEKKK